MTFYVVLLYDVSGRMIQEKSFEDYNQAHEFIFNSQFDIEEAAAGKLLMVTELYGNRCLEKLLEMFMSRPVEDPALQQEYLEYRGGD